MLSIARTKELIGYASISDEQAEAIRDQFRDLAELIFINWKTNLKQYDNESSNNPN
ncbi:hypothetical protein HYV70_02435 [Candidatus Uhrbacteria bacterium]|nr:hypothetical protein [Candidatus Uhrbacteria bacterium]